MEESLQVVSIMITLKIVIIEADENINKSESMDRVKYIIPCTLQESSGSSWYWKFGVEVEKGTMNKVDAVRSAYSYI